MPLPKLYGELADWWPLFSHPDHYVDEAAWILETFRRTLGRPPDDILELGSGGGNTASHMSRHTSMTLVDLSPAMLAVSRRLNPHCRHVEGDMRSLRLHTTFDAVFIHDAIMYMTTADDLVAALATAREHLRPDGALMVLPDHVAETFEPKVATGGRDASEGRGRGLRYIEWTHAPACGASVYTADYAILLRDPDGSMHVLHDRHMLGLFAHDTWREAFFRAKLPSPDLCFDPWGRDVFVARVAV